MSSQKPLKSYFSRGGPGERIHKSNCRRTLVVDQGFFAMLEDLFFAEAAMAYHCGFHGIHARQPNRVNFDFDDLGQQCYDLFHFPGNHFKTESIDELRQPALEVNLALQVNSRQVASLKPAVVKSDTTDSVFFQIACHHGG